MPYAVLGVAGFAGYTYLRKKGVFDDIGKTVDNIANVPKSIVDIFRERSGVDSFTRGDFIGGAQTILRNSPVINLAEKGYNAIKDNLPEIDPPKLPDPPKVTEENTGISESFWTDTPIKYVPAVAIRNGITKLFGR